MKFIKVAAGVYALFLCFPAFSSYQQCPIDEHFSTWTSEGSQKNGAKSGFYSPWCSPPHGNGPVIDLKDCYTESWVTVSGSESGTFWHQDRVEKNGIVIGGHESANHTSRRVVTVPLTRKSCTRPSTAFEFSCSTNPNGSFTDNWNWECAEGEEPEACEAEGFNGVLSAEQRVTYAYPNDQNVCVNGCMSNRTQGFGIDIEGVGNGLTGTYWAMTGESCGGSGEYEEPGEEGPECDTLNGVYVCRSENVNCMVVDGQEVCGSGAGGVCIGSECLDDGELHEYLQAGNTSVITNAQAQVPPAVDTGRPGERAPPDLPIKVPSGQRNPAGRDYHYWGPGTVGNSSNYGGNNECDPETEDCSDPGGHGECDPETEICGPCDPLTEECGDGAEFTAPGVAYKYAGIDDQINAKRKEIAEFIVGVQNDMMAKLGGGLSDGAGALPCPQFEALGVTIDFCVPEFEQALSLIRPAILLLASVMAGFIILGAKT